METRYVRLLSSLCAQTYYLNKMTVRSLSILHTQRPPEPVSLTDGRLPPRADVSEVDLR